MHFSELLIVLIVILVVFPPKKLPELAQTLVRFIKAFRRIKSEVFASLEPLEKKIELEHNIQRAEKAEHER